MWQSLNFRYKAIAVLVVVVVLAAAAYAGWQHFRRPAVTVMQTEELQSVAKLQQALDLSKSEATALQSEIAKVNKQKPAASYTVQAETLADGANVVAKQIKNNTVPITLPPAEKTIVAANNTEQKVDVYRINLEPKQLWQATYYQDKSFDIAYSRRIMKHIYAGPAIKFDDGETTVGVRVTYAK